MKKVNIVIGRFQPFTTGHYKCVEAAWNQKGLPTIICMINTPESKVDTRHPFPSDMLISLYDELFSNNNKIVGIILVRNADIVKISEEVRKYGLEIASWTCGTDRFKSYSRMANRYGDLAKLSGDFEMIEVSRSDEDVSATKARNCLLNNDREGFLQLIPDGQNEDNLFNELRNQLNKVYRVTNENLVKRINRLENLIICK